MAVEFETESSVHGYHVYQENWTPIRGGRNPITLVVSYFSYTNIYACVGEMVTYRVLSICYWQPFAV